MTRRMLSLEGRTLLLCSLLALAGTLLGILMAGYLREPLLAVLLSALIVLPVTMLAVRHVMAPVTRHLRALVDGVSSLRDGDFSVSLAITRHDELGELADVYNSVGDILRSERQNLYQRELLLDTVIQSSPQSLVLTDTSGHVLYANTAARKRFHRGRRMEGLVFQTLLQQSPPGLREAATAERDGLYTVEADGEEPEIVHVTRNQFTLNTREHRLYQFRSLTRELTRQELQTWKKVIRVISHELNNSLAPISSLAHSGRLAVQAQRHDLLDDIFVTIEERSARLKQFLENYARFAKLPQPRKVDVDWAAFLARLGRTVPYRPVGEPPTQPSRFDAAQIEQVLINLLKNAHESGGPADEVCLAVETQADGQVLLRVLDRGPGMSDSVLASALLPFYSTKPDGTGLGLTLCREIVEAHGGRVALANRIDGGLEVRLWLPGS
ncbi:PAS domain-containing protein [Hydrocarboniphaga daqingensis]|uniref:histidine kinase n=1 Tax=Hydrocarboniphaga daqingensis TaxID=490188 RepID=A0A1M5MT96_9GAMM|nr:ATP-binding protein [Hydrocarboniphaga daqingensis]SHG80471.1 PAS domain-containing protein [Hydrocarboniphaga daqingensis]